MSRWFTVAIIPAFFIFAKLQLGLATISQLVFESRKKWSAIRDGISRLNLALKSSGAKMRVATEYDIIGERCVLNLISDMGKSVQLSEDAIVHTEIMELSDLASSVSESVAEYNKYLKCAFALKETEEGIERILRNRVFRIRRRYPWLGFWTFSAWIPGEARQWI